MATLFSRTIATSFQLIALDSQGNQAYFPLGAQVACRLQRTSPISHADSLPQLVDANEAGELLGDIAPNRSCATFHSLVLVGGVGTGEGAVELVFTLQMYGVRQAGSSASTSSSSSSSSTPNVGPVVMAEWTLPLHYAAASEDAAVLLTELQRELATVTENIRIWTADKANRDRDRRQIDAALMQLQPLVLQSRLFTDNPAAATCKDSLGNCRIAVRTEQREVQSKISVRERTMQGRPVRKPAGDPPPDILEAVKEDLVGVLVDLASVDDEQTARIMRSVMFSSLRIIYFCVLILLLFFLVSSPSPIHGSHARVRVHLHT